MISKRRKNDLILISILVIIAALFLLVMSLTRKEGGYATVVVDGIETASYPLNEDITVRLENPKTNGYNILVIKDGVATISEANCPDKLCVKQQDVKFNGQTLVCLPNKTTVKIVNSIESSTDFIS